MSRVVIPIDFPEWMSKQERMYHANRAIVTAVGAGGNAFPKTVCAPHERPVDSVSRYEKAENAYCLRNGISRGGGGQ